MQTEVKPHIKVPLKHNRGMYRKFLKRPMDFVLSLLAIIVLSPVLLIVSILVRFKLGRPVIFKQKRPGFNEKIFILYKFRTMNDEMNENGELLSDGVRLTKFGRLLRNTSLDELPELFNILKGNMSFVGPRPQLIKDMVFMTSKQRLRYSVLPGLSGWAQINGRNKVTWEEKLSLDLEYLKDISFVRDWKIIFRTVTKVFRKDDISSEGMETAEDLGDYMLRTGKVDPEKYKKLVRTIENNRKGEQIMKTVWILNQYNMPPEYGHLNRHYIIAKYLKRLGHNPIVLVGSYLHNTNIQIINDNSIMKKYEKSDFQYYFVKTMDYSLSRLTRVYTMFEYCRNVYRIRNKLNKPDVIVGSSAHPLAAVAAIRLSKKYGCQSIVEVRDLWPESFISYGIINKKNPLLKLLFAGEKWIYKKADKLIYTMEGGKDYLVEKRWNKESGGPIDLNKVFHINNGVDNEVFKYNKEHYLIIDEDLNNDKNFKVIYTGSIRMVNNVKKIVDAAMEIKYMGIEDIKFIIYGDGSDKERLEKYCNEHGIDNVIFKGFIDKKYIPFILSNSDLNILHFEQSNIKKYGASLNKMFEYFASEKPTLSDCEFNYDIIKKRDCGVVIDNADAKILANQIVRFKNMEEEEYNLYCKNAVNAAKEYDYKILTKNLIKVFEGV